MRNEALLEASVDEALTHLDLRVMAYLCAIGGRCRDPQAVIAANLGCHRGSLNRAIGRLEDAGYLHRVANRCPHGAVRPSTLVVCEMRRIAA